MSEDERPEPRYGVYATPEEQRARIQKPDATWSLETGESVTDAASAASPDRAAPGSGASSVGARSGAIDRIVTFALLAYALVNVAVAALALLDFPQYAATVFEVMGIPGEYTNLDGGRVWGTAAAISLVLGYLIPDVLYGEPDGIIREPIAAAGLFELSCGALILSTSPKANAPEKKKKRRTSPSRKSAK